MTINLNPSANHEKISKIEEDFFDISLRKSNESISERSRRVLEYFNNLQEYEKKIIELRFPVLLEHLRESMEYYFK